jgi:hypothetical protein
MSKYDPHSRQSRVSLAADIEALCERALFLPIQKEGTKERLFAREVPDTDGKVRVLVYSTIEGDETRKCGKDAIRVCAVYRGRDGKERGIASADRRVNRTGTTEAICERVIDRMRQCWKATKTASKCSCGAPQFKSKKGRLVCADFHWKSDAEMAADDYRRPQRRRYYGGRDYAATGAYASGRW